MTNTYRYIYKHAKPVVIKILGYLIATFAIIKFIDSPITSTISGLLATSIFLYQSGIEVDLNKNKYRLINAFGPFTFGSWRNLPALKYISVFKANLVSSMSGRSGAMVTLQKDVIQVNLITKDNQRLTLFETEDAKKAFDFAKEMATSLDLKIWDATTQVAQYI